MMIPTVSQVQLAREIAQMAALAYPFHFRGNPSCIIVTETMAQTQPCSRLRQARFPRLLAYMPFLPIGNPTKRSSLIVPESYGSLRRACVRIRNWQSHRETAGGFSFAQTNQSSDHSGTHNVENNRTSARASRAVTDPAAVTQSATVPSRVTLPHGDVERLEICA